jgi:hypothetical protein
MIETELRLEKATESKILSRCGPLSNGSPRLAVVPFDDGDVQCIALNLQGPGGTTATPTPGSITFVEKIMGSAKPSLQGNNTAAFSITLDQQGATLMEQVFKEGGGPVGVIYQLKFTALRPSLDVEISADFKRVYDSLRLGVDFSAGFLAGGVPVYLKAGLDAAFEKLKQDGVIDIKVVNASNSADAADKERWALDFFKTNLLADWFKPTLPPVQFPSQSGTGNSVNLPGIGNLPLNIPGAGGSTGGGSGSGSGASGGGASTGGGSTGGASTGGGSGGASGSSGSGATGASGSSGSTGSSGSSGSASTGSGSSTGAGHPAGGSSTGSSGGASSGSSLGTAVLEAAPSPAVLQVTTREPSSAPADFRIDFTPSSSGQQETLTFLGGSQVPVVRVNGAERALDAQRRLALDVPPGTTLNIRAEYPGEPATTELFFLFFDFERPEPAGFSALPPSASYQSYLANAPNPPDQRFTATDGTIAPDGSSTQGGAAALRDWIQNRLATPKQVTVDAHASYEGDDSKASFNLQLTQRRRQVAVGIIGTLAQVTGGTFHGFQEARAAGRVGDPMDRVVEIRGRGLSGDPVTLTATLTRPAAPGGGGVTPGGGGTTPGGGGTTPSGGGTTPSGGGSTPSGGNTPSRGGNTPSGGTSGGGAGAPGGMGVSLAFKMQIINQEELKTVKVHYNRTEAIQLPYNPPGFIGLLTQDIGPGHFFEVDLDDPFFRTIDIVTDAPIDYDRIGLISAQMALDYGSPADPAGVKHVDFSFDKAGPKEQGHSFFMNALRDTSFKVGVQYHFDQLSGWEGEKLSYDLPVKTTEDRTLLLNPFEDFGFLEIKVLPGDIDPSAVKSTDVHLRYEDPGVFVKEQVITLKPDSPEQTWKLRLTHPERREVSHFFVHHLVDGSVRQSPTVTSSATTIAVDDSFEDALDIEFVPIYNTATIRSVFALVHYEDPAHSYVRDVQLEFSGDAPERQRLHIALFDPNVKEYQLTYTVLGKDNSVRRLSPLANSAKLVFVGETF